MRIDILVFKSLEFKNGFEQKVKVIHIPVLKETDPNYFMIQVRLQAFIRTIYRKPDARKCYSFQDYLKRMMGWPEYEKLFMSSELKNNA